MTSLLFSGYDHRCNNSLARTRNVIDNVRVNNASQFLIEIIFILKAMKSHFKNHMINKILHSSSLHMKFVKRAFGEFHKFHMN